MNIDDKRKLRAYLSGPRDYSEGVALYAAYGYNLRLKKQFSIDDSEVTRQILIEELRKLAGLTEAEFISLPRMASGQSTSEPVDAAVDPEPAPTAVPVSETTARIIRFRERFPFLNSPECPDKLKVLVADMFTAFGRYKEAHSRLVELGDDDTAAAYAECREIVENYLDNREIWAELEYYRDNGVVLGKAQRLQAMEAEENLAQVSDVDLVSQLRSAEVQVSKQKRKISTAKTADGKSKAETAMEYWSARRNQLKEELERRKKK